MKCKYCGGENEKDLDICIFCGGKLEARISSVKVSSKPGLCSSCGYQNITSSKTCSNCGENLENTNVDNVINKEAGKEKNEELNDKAENDNVFGVKENNININIPAEVNSNVRNIVIWTIILVVLCAIWMEIVIYQEIDDDFVGFVSLFNIIVGIFIGVKGLKRLKENNISNTIKTLKTLRIITLINASISFLLSVDRGSGIGPLIVFIILSVVLFKRIKKLKEYI